MSGRPVEGEAREARWGSGGPGTGALAALLGALERRRALFWTGRVLVELDREFDPLEEGTGAIQMVLDDQDFAALKALAVPVEREHEDTAGDCTCQKTPEGVIGWDRSMVSPGCPQHGHEALPTPTLPALDFTPKGECPLCGGETDHADSCYVGEMERRLAGRELEDTQGLDLSYQDAEFAAWTSWKPDSPPDKRDTHCHGFDAGYALALRSRQGLRERMELIERFARQFSDAACEGDCEGTGIDSEGGEWTLCECALTALQRLERGELAIREHEDSDAELHRACEVIHKALDGGWADVAPHPSASDVQSLAESVLAAKDLPMLRAPESHDEVERAGRDDRRWTAVGEQAGAARAGETMWSGPHLAPGERVVVVPLSEVERLQETLRGIDQSAPSGELWQLMGDSWWANIGRAAVTKARAALAATQGDCE